MENDKKRTRSTHLGKNIFQCFTDWNGTKGKLNFDIFFNLKINIIIS